jgi:hypothetical protein
VLEHLGDYYEKAGDEARAKGYWKRALAAGPETPAAKGALEKKIGSDPAVSPAAPVSSQTANSLP